MKLKIFQSFMRQSDVTVSALVVRKCINVSKETDNAYFALHKNVAVPPAPSCLFKRLARSRNRRTQFSFLIASFISFEIIF